MLSNHSPWLKQLRRTRPIAYLPGDARVDVAIVGGGIAGVTTAYFLLRDTKLTVALIEAGKVAHGATGHNAGQAVTYFERSFADLVKEFGLEMAAQGQKMIDNTWELIEEIYRDTQLETPFSRFTGYAGCSTIDQFIIHLQNNAWRLKGGLNTEPMYIAKECKEKDRIPREFASLYSEVAHEDLLSLLETHDARYIGLVVDPKGVVNSALFCEELVGFMINHYGERFVLAEHTPVRTVRLHQHDAELELDGKQVKANRVVLCTNGFTSINIENTHGGDIDTKFHHEVTGTVGYMAGYLEPLDHPPVGISYFVQPSSSTDDPYFYITRRAYEEEKNSHHNLICVGGPERVLEKSYQYETGDPMEDDVIKEIDAFIRQTREHPPKSKDYQFHWHGLMGYTRNRLRLVGFEPCNPVLMYNLGCNGTGILASICGAKRIARLADGEVLPKSIFDPADQRCALPPRAAKA